MQMELIQIMPRIEYLSVVNPFTVCVTRVCDILALITELKKNIYGKPYVSTHLYDM